MAVPALLLRYLPPRWTIDPLMRGVAEALSGPFDGWRRLAETLHEYLDPLLAPEDWLDFLADLVALPRVFYLAVTNQRAWIDQAFSTWERKGLKATIEAYVEAITQSGCNVYAPGVDTFRASVSKAGDIVSGGAGKEVWYFRLDCYPPVLPGGEAELRRLLEFVVPAVCRYDVNTILLPL